MAGSFPKASQAVPTREIISYDASKEDAQDPRWFLRSKKKRKASRSLVSAEKRGSSPLAPTKSLADRPAESGPYSARAPTKPSDEDEHRHRSVSERASSQKPPSSVGPSPLERSEVRDKLWWKSVSQVHGNFFL